MAHCWQNLLFYLSVTDFPISFISYLLPCICPAVVTVCPTLMPLTVSLLLQYSVSCAPSPLCQVMLVPLWRRYHRHYSWCLVFCLFTLEGFWPHVCLVPFFWFVRLCVSLCINQFTSKDYTLAGPAPKLWNDQLRLDLLFLNPLLNILLKNFSLSELFIYLPPPGSFCIDFCLLLNQFPWNVIFFKNFPSI